MNDERTNDERKSSGGEGFLSGPFCGLLSLVTAGGWWAIGAVLFVIALVVVGGTIISLMLDETICADRWPWWGPPEQPSSCAGLYYESKHGAGR